MFLLLPYSSSGGSGERVNLGFLISERILNMPPQISVPMYETLQKELRKAVAKNLPFDFTHFVMISRQVILSMLLGQAFFWTV